MLRKHTMPLLCVAVRECIILMRTTKLEMELRAYAICDATDDFSIRCSVIHAKETRSRHLYTYRCAWSLVRSMMSKTPNMCRTERW